MPHDPVRVAETRAWLAKAVEDMRMGELALGACPRLLGGAVFHAQQAAEKTLKGYLVWHDRPFRRTHDLAEIGQACAEVDPGLDPVWQKADKLTAYAWVFRYPGDEHEPTLAETEEAMALAREVYEAILSRLPAAVRP